MRGKVVQSVTQTQMKVKRKKKKKGGGGGGNVWFQPEVVIATLSLFFFMPFILFYHWVKRRSYFLCARVCVCVCVCVWQVGTCCAVREWWVRQDDRLAQGASRTATEHARIWGEVSVLQPAKQKHTGTLRKRWFREETNRGSTSDIYETWRKWIKGGFIILWKNTRNCALRSLAYIFFWGGAY